MPAGMVAPDLAHGRRFFASTRGRLIALLRRAVRTVEELAEALNLTDNAVRAHLTSLERDGLVRQQGVRRGGVGKPAYTYGLTEDAEALFPKAYGELLRQLLTLLSQRLTAGHHASGPPEERVAAAVAYLNELGGLAEWTAMDSGYKISGCR